MPQIIARFTYGYNFTAYLDWIPNRKLIFDRTQEDVDRVKELNQKFRLGTITDEEKLEWQGEMKGALNYSDLERITYYIDFLGDVLDIEVTPQVIPEIPRASWYEVLLENLEELRDNYMIHPDTPMVPSQPLNTYQKWNDIEKILYDLYGIYSARSVYYTGQELYTNNWLI